MCNLSAGWTVLEAATFLTLMFATVSHARAASIHLDKLASSPLFGCQGSKPVTYEFQVALHLLSRTATFACFVLWKMI